MKKYLAALSATALISAAPYAVAAASVDLTVTGLITPEACVPSLSSSFIDYGTISAKTIKSNQPTPLAPYPLQLTVVCDAPMLFALKSVDNNDGTEIVPEYFGLGLTNANEKVGLFNVIIKKTLADNVEAQAIGSEDNGATWKRQDNIFKHALSAVGATSDHGTRIPVEYLTMDLEIRAVIAPASLLTLTDEIKMDGSAVIQLTYL